MYLWLIILAGCIWAVWHFTKNSNAFPKKNAKDASLEILKRRFAKGQITVEEYEEKRAMLEDDVF